jgi:hypothetical protein
MSDQTKPRGKTLVLEMELLPRPKWRWNRARERFTPASG